MFMRPGLDNNNILVDVYLIVGFKFSVKAYRNCEEFQSSRISLSNLKHY